MNDEIMRYDKDGRTIREFRSETTKDPIDWAKKREAELGKKVDAIDLDGQTIIITGARQFPTAYAEQVVNPWFIVAVVEKTGEKINTVLGGDAVARELDLYAQMSEGAPMKVTLQWNPGKGAFDGYYTFK